MNVEVDRLSQKKWRPIPGLDGIWHAERENWRVPLRSDYLGRQKDYLSYSVLGLLLREGKVSRKNGTKVRHVPKA